MTTELEKQIINDLIKESELCVKYRHYIESEVVNISIRVIKKHGLKDCRIGVENAIDKASINDILLTLERIKDIIYKSI